MSSVISKQTLQTVVRGPGSCSMPITGKGNWSASEVANSTALRPAGQDFEAFGLNIDQVRDDTLEKLGFEVGSDFAPLFRRWKMDRQHDAGVVSATSPLAHYGEFFAACLEKLAPRIENGKLMKGSQLVKEGIAFSPKEKQTSYAIREIHAQLLRNLHRVGVVSETHRLLTDAAAEKDQPRYSVKHFMHHQFVIGPTFLTRLSNWLTSFGLAGLGQSIASSGEIPFFIAGVYFHYCSNCRHHTDLTRNFYFTELDALNISLSRENDAASGKSGVRDRCYARTAIPELAHNLKMYERFCEAGTLPNCKVPDVETPPLDTNRTDGNGILRSARKKVNEIPLSGQSHVNPGGMIIDDALVLPPAPRYGLSPHSSWAFFESMAEPQTDIQQLWKSYQQLKGEESESKLFRHYIPFALVMLRSTTRSLPSTIDFDSVCSAAMTGLLEAVRRYDPNQGRFEKFASARIYGAIKDDLRSQDVLTRKDRQLLETMETAIQGLKIEGHCSSDPVLLAQEMERMLNSQNPGAAPEKLDHVSTVRLETAKRLRNATLLSAPTNGSFDTQKTVGDTIPEPDDTICDDEFEAVLASFHSLEPHEREALSLYFQRGVPLCRIADQYKRQRPYNGSEKLSESRMSQIFQDIFDKMFAEQEQRRPLKFLAERLGRRGPFLFSQEWCLGRN